MNDRTHQIYDELEQLCEQYKREVPGHRHAWPKSIKERIFELQKCGERVPVISERIGVSSQTIFSWNYARKIKEKSQNFLPVKVVATPTVTVEAKSSPQLKQNLKTSTVTVITPGGYRIEGDILLKNP